MDPIKVKAGSEIRYNAVLLKIKHRGT